jgi:hypothetical protein
MSMKVVEGQLAFWEMASALSMGSRSITSSMFRDFVSDVSSSQSIAPDEVPRQVTVKPIIEQETGKIVTSVG